MDPIAQLLVDGAYDSAAGNAVSMAKAALLNLYFSLSRTAEPISANRSWFSFVRRIVAIGRERFIALANASNDDDALYAFSDWLVSSAPPA